MRVSFGPVLALAFVACSGLTVDLGGPPGDAGVTADGSVTGPSPDASVSGDEGASGADGTTSGNTQDGGDGDPISPPVQASCDGASYAGPKDDGGGYTAGSPACGAADGPVETPTSTSQIAQEIVGSWLDCSGVNAPILSALTPPGDSNVAGLEFTSDGNFFLLDANSDQIARHDPPVTGTYQVVDASATLGTGTYQLRMQQPSGTVSLPQILVLDSPRKVRLVFTSLLSTEDFVVPSTFSFRAGVCDYTQFGPPHIFTGPADIEARIKGRWAWCWGPLSYMFSGLLIVGIEFPGDGTLYWLVQDASGHVTRSTGGGGTYTISGDGMITFPGNPPPAPWQPYVAECQQALTFYGTGVEAGSFGQEPVFQPFP